MNDTPAYDISFCSDDEDEPPHQCAMRRAIEATLHRHKMEHARINVAVVDDEHMAQLNELYLGHHGPTDVLTFDLRDSTDDPSTPVDRLELSNMPGIEGEIVLSIDTATREAEARDHSVESEMALYAVHGTLHLLGHDDQSESDAASMHEIENAILSEVGLGVAFGSEEW
jgi:probable rRNA maturation factor